MSLIRTCAAVVIAAILCLAGQPAVAGPLLADSAGPGVNPLVHLAQAQAPAPDDDDDDDDDEDGEGEDDGDDEDDDDGDDEGDDAAAPPKK